MRFLTRSGSLFVPPNALPLDISKIPLSLYVHVPWCVKKCPYCDFNSHTQRADTDFSGYVDALIADVKDQLSYVQGRELVSIFFGGGTPSLLPTAELARLMNALREHLSFANDIEITLEANPGTLEHAPFSDYLDVGINRLSLGVQSFSDRHLHKLGRVHGSDEAKQAIKLARQAGFERLNVDLMHGLPEQTHGEAALDLEAAIDCGATHISWYQLTIEQNTAFYRERPVLPQEDELAAIQQAGEALLTQSGFRQYEVSAWAAEQPSKHNLNYWQFGDYLAIGAGAHGKVSVQNHDSLADGIYRFQNSRLPKDYLSCLPAKRIKFQPVGSESLPFEFMMNGLRLVEGVPTELFGQRTGESYAKVEAVLGELAKKELIEVGFAEQIRCTELGMRFLNHVLSVFE